MPDFDPNLPRWTGDAAIPQEQRFAAAPSFPPTRSGIQAYRAMQAQKLHEMTFGQKSQLDFAKLDIAQQKLLLDKAATVEKITAGNHSREMEGRRSLSAAAAIEKLGTLDHTDPKFEQKLSQILGQYPDALNSPSLMQAVSGQRSLAQAYTKALHERTAASFGDPMAKAAYEKTLAETKDPHLANIAAQATAEHVEKAKALYGSADLTPADRLAIFDPNKGSFDFSQLNALEMKANAAKAARESAAKGASATSNVGRALEAFAKSYGDKQKPGEPEWVTASRTNMQQALRNETWSAAGSTSATPVTPATPAAAAAAANDPFAKYTGAPMNATAAEAAKLQQSIANGAGNLPGSPQQAAALQQSIANGGGNLNATPTPTPAPTPVVTAAAPDGDMASRFAPMGGSPMDAPILNDPRYAQASGAAVAQPADAEEPDDENTES